MAQKKNKKTVKKAAGKAKKAIRKAKVARKTAPKRPAKAARASAAKGKALKAKKTVDPSLEKIGEVTHYFPHVNAAAVKIMKDALRVGDRICIKGHTTDFNEDVVSIQLDHASIAEGKKGQEIGLQVKERVRIGDTVYRIKK